MIAPAPERTSTAEHRHRRLSRSRPSPQRSSWKSSSMPASTSIPRMPRRTAAWAPSTSARRCASTLDCWNGIVSTNACTASRDGAAASTRRDVPAVGCGAGSLHRGGRGLVPAAGRPPRRSGPGPVSSLPVAHGEWAPGPVMPDRASLLTPPRTRFWGDPSPPPRSRSPAPHAPVAGR